MRVKVDESLSRHIASLCQSLGHDADTVYDEGLNGLPDARVLDRAKSEGRMLLTADRGFGDTRHYPLGTHCGVVVFNVASADAPAILAFVRRFMEGRDLAALQDCLVIVSEDKVRVRRPER